MADLDSLLAAQTIKIAGAAPSGLESNFVQATNTNEIKSADFLSNAVAQGTVSVSTGSGPLELKAGGTPLANRKTVMFQVQGANVVFGFSAGTQSFTTTTGSVITVAVGPGIPVYVDRTSGIGSVNVVFAEFS